MEELTVQFFGAAWCAPCKLAKPKIQELCNKFGIQLVMYEYDDMEEDAKANISKLPTVQIWNTKKNEKVHEIVTNHVTLFESWCSANVRVIPSDDF